MRCVPLVLLIFYWATRSVAVVVVLTSLVASIVATVLLLFPTLLSSICECGLSAFFLCFLTPVLSFLAKYRHEHEQLMTTTTSIPGEGAEGARPDRLQHGLSGDSGGAVGVGRGALSGSPRPIWRRHPHGAQWFGGGGYRRVVSSCVDSLALVLHRSALYVPPASGCPLAPPSFLIVSAS